MPSEQPGWPIGLRHVLEAIAECRAFVAGMSCWHFLAPLTHEPSASAALAFTSRRIYHRDISP